LQVACVADEKYLPHCAAMLHSLLQFHPDALVNYLHGPGLSGASFAPIASMVACSGGTFTAHEVPDTAINGLQRLREIPPIMWYRVYLPDLLPETDRVLYLDVDTLIVDDLTELWNTDLQDRYLAAVSNTLPPESRGWPRRLGIPAEQGYFNSGVLLLNLEMMRRNQMTERLIAYGRNPGLRLAWPDQDALNKLMGHRRVSLHPRWNCQNSLFYYRWGEEIFGRRAAREALGSPAILHFEGAQVVKPWHYLSKHPHRKKYIEHRTATAWPTVELEGKTTLNRFLRLLPMRATIRILATSFKVRMRFRKLLSGKRGYKIP
jgi:lipopolysaccharide biosynthesis glycosyltransferase